MQFYDFFRSSAAHRVRIAINLKNITCNWYDVRITENENLKPDYLALNPLGIVPTLVDGDTTITQSIAIIEYLDELYPEPPLHPETPEARARTRSLSLSIACEIHPLNIGRVVKFLSGDLQVDEEGIQRWCLCWLTTGLNAIEALLSSTPGTGEFCQGDSPTMADVCLVPQAYNALNRFKLDIGAYPTIQRIYETCMTIPAFASASPDVKASSY